MKGKILGVVALAFTAILWLQSTTSHASSIDYWDITKEYTLDQGGVRYHTYLSKDKKESWVYKIELLEHYKVLDITVPDKIQGGVVTCLGVTSELYKVWSEIEYADYYATLFDQIIEPWHDNDEAPSPKVYNVRSFVMPDTIDEMGPAAFAVMVNLRYVHLSNKITTLGKFTFYGCRDLQKIDFAPEVEIPNSLVFQYCEGLKGLMEESEFRREGMTISCKGDMIFNKEEKILIQVMPFAKKITIPADVKAIEPSAFTGSSLETVKVAKKNKYFAVQGRCLYQKKGGKLILAFGKGSKLTLSKKIKKIDKDARVTKYTIKKLVMPKKLKRSSGWKKTFIANNSNVIIYYCGKRIR